MFGFSIQVNIYNKCGAQLLVNGEQVMKKRPLLNDSQILIPNNIRFRWIHSHDVADARGKVALLESNRSLYAQLQILFIFVSDSEFASWSDPGKKVRVFEWIFLLGKYLNILFFFHIDQSQT